MTSAQTTTRRRFLSAKELAGQWGVPVSAVYRLCRDGEIRARKFNGGWAIHESAIEEYERGGDDPRSFTHD